MVRSIFVVALFESEKRVVRRAGFVTRRPTPGCRSAEADRFCHLFCSYTTTGLSFRVLARGEEHVPTRLSDVRPSPRRRAPVAARGSFNPQRVALRASPRSARTTSQSCDHKSRPFRWTPEGQVTNVSVVYTDRAMNHMSKPFCKPYVSRCGRHRHRRAASAWRWRRPSPPCVSRHRSKHAHEKYRTMTMRTGCVSRRGIWRVGRREEARGGRVGTSVGSRAAYGASRESAPTRRRLFRAALAPARARACRTARPRQQKPTRRNVSYRRFVRFDRGIDRGPTRRAGFERRTRRARIRCRFSHARRFFFSFLRRRSRPCKCRDRSHTLHDRS